MMYMATIAEFSLFKLFDFLMWSAFYNEFLALLTFSICIPEPRR